jgi:hypothetical protein
LKHPDGPFSCTAHFSTPTGQIITTIVGDITDMETDVLLCSSDRVLKLGIGVGKSLVTELPTFPEHLSSPPVFSGVRVTRSLFLFLYKKNREHNGQKKKDKRINNNLTYNNTNHS